MTTTGQCRHWLVVFALSSSLVSNRGARHARAQRGRLSVAVAARRLFQCSHASIVSSTRLSRLRTFATRLGLPLRCARSRSRSRATASAVFSNSTAQMRVPSSSAVRDHAAAAVLGENSRERLESARERGALGKHVLEVGGDRSHAFPLRNDPLRLTRAAQSLVHQLVDSRAHGVRRVRAPDTPAAMRAATLSEVASAYVRYSPGAN
jgi:hypothetical protein